MTVLNPSTARRLNKLRQTTEIWEGDRRPLPTGFPGANELETSDWVVWADRNHVIRSMDVVPAQEGPEALVRTLIAAMESPQGPAQPERPRAIVVRDRETQFFLRGALQNLDIQVNYAPILPLVEDICQELEALMTAGPPPLPSACNEPLSTAAATLWRDAPWTQLGDHQILELTLSQGDLRTLYISVLGLLGTEYGLLFYRTEESLRQFRQQVTDRTTDPEEMEAIFLRQDCLFLNFEPADDSISTPPFSGDLEQDGMEPIFGSIHPLEGMRIFLDEEEAVTLTLALEALHRFWSRHRQKLEVDQFPAISGRYQIPHPLLETAASVQIKTLPTLATDLWAAGFSDDDAGSPFGGVDQPVLRQDLIPENAFFSLGMMPWHIVEILRLSALHYQGGEVTMAGDGLPILMIQTSRPKAKAMVETLKSAGGIVGLGFTPGASPFEEELYDLGILKTEDQQLFLFGEYFNSSAVHRGAKQKWNQRSKKTKGWCGFVIAQGISGKSRGQPTINDFVALFEVSALSEQELGLGMLQLMPQMFP
jgi:hypothetical protein